MAASISINKIETAERKIAPEQNGHTPSSGGGDSYALEFHSTLEVAHRHGNQRLEVRRLCYDVNERGMEWWQKLASFQIPWRKDEKENEQKRILNDITFDLQNGQMLAVMGSSGSGKTSLLDTIACQTTSGDVTGGCLINGKERTAEMIKQCSAYVRQDDRLLPHLTVKETLMFVAELKLPRSWSPVQIEDRVDSVIAELGLRHVANSKVGGAETRGISGGERRRVSIGIQLLLDPGILFLDEPTSGLDAFTAHHLVETLAKLARNNRIVMITIHQPRSDIFSLFDMTMLLSRGRVVYYGKASEMIGYFTDIGHPCPPLTNPCDFYVDLTTIDMKSDETEAATSRVVNELASMFNRRRKDTMVDHESDRTSDSNETNAHGLTSRASKDSTNLTTDKRSKINSVGIDNLAFEEDAESETNGYAPNSMKCTENQNSAHTSLTMDTSSLGTQTDKANQLDQFSVLIRRSLSNNLEDYYFLGVQAAEAFFMSLIIGLIFFDLGFDQIAVRDRFGLLYIVNALYPYMVMLDVIGQYHRERHVLYYEMMDGLYTTNPYFFSKILCEIPEHTVFVILYAIPVYFLADLQPGPEHFFLNFFIVYITVYCSRSLAYLCAALLPNYQLSVLLAQAAFTLFLLSCGFIFNLDNLFVGVKWTQHISYLKYGFQAVCTVEYIGLNFTCDLPQQDSCIWTGEEALELYSLDGLEVWIGCLIVLFITFIFLALFYITLRYIPQKPQEQ